jgi:hypothetical protein
MSHFFVCFLSRSNTQNCKLHVKRSELSSRSAARWSLREEVGVYMKFTWSHHLLGSHTHTQHAFIYLGWRVSPPPHFRVWKVHEAFLCCIFVRRWARPAPSGMGVELPSSSFNKKINWIFGLLRCWESARYAPAPFMGVKRGIINSFTCQKIPALFSQVRSQRNTKPWMKTHAPECLGKLYPKIFTRRII